MKKEEFADREKDRNKAVPAPSEGELLPELGNSEGKKYPLRRRTCLRKLRQR